MWYIFFITICYFYNELLILIILGLGRKRIEKKTSFARKKFNCTFCSYATFQKCNLRAHLFTHTQEKPFQCPECLKKFRLKHHLQLHLLIHTGEKPHSCLKCGKLFRTKSQLKIHLSSCCLEDLSFYGVQMWSV